MSGTFPASLEDLVTALGARLHWPDNVGVELCQVTLPTEPEVSILIAYIQGLADDELIRALILEPLERAAANRLDVGRLTPDRLAGILPAPRSRTVSGLDEAVHGIVGGETAIFLGRARCGLLIDTVNPVSRPVGSLVPENPYKDLFDSSLVKNVAQIRKRLRDPALVAQPCPLPGERANATAVVYLKGRAPDALVREVRQWLVRHGGEEALHRGLAGGWKGKLGVLPDLMSTPWPDKVAPLIDAGYVAVLVDQVPFAFTAPVTAPAVLYSPTDNSLNRPVSALYRLLRILLAGFILTAPGGVIALLNYHQEMIPTAFLLTMAAVREELPLPLGGAVVALEVMQEILLREATARLPYRVSTGAALIAGKLVILLLVFSNVIGPIPGIVSVLVQLAGLAMPTYDLLHLVRWWRFAVIFGAVAAPWQRPGARCSWPWPSFPWRPSFWRQGIQPPGS